MHWISLIICLSISLADAKLPNIYRKPNELIGGRTAKDGEVKYIVVVRDGNGICGGGIIGEKFIITAAHCITVDEISKKLIHRIRIIGGTTVVDGYLKSHVIERDVARAYLPGLFKRDGGLNDIAVLELTEPLQLIKHSKKLQKLYLPEPFRQNPPIYSTYENERVKFAGYGDTHAIVYNLYGRTEVQSYGAGRLHVAEALINDKRTCTKYMPPRRFLDQICLSIVEDKTNRKPQGTCSGDSGGPAVYNDNIVIGLTSWGINCDTNFVPAVFTRVSYYVPFIKNVMKNVTAGLLVYEACSSCHNVV